MPCIHWFDVNIKKHTIVTGMIIFFFYKNGKDLIKLKQLGSHVDLSLELKVQ